MVLILTCHYFLFVCEFILLAANSLFKVGSLNKNSTAQIGRSYRSLRHIEALS